jgi:hypothetical protein
MQDAKTYTENESDWYGLTATPDHLRATLLRLRQLAHGGFRPQEECLGCGGPLVQLITLQRCASCGEPWPLPVGHLAGASRGWDRFQDGIHVATGSP